MQDFFYAKFITRLHSVLNFSYILYLYYIGNNLTKGGLFREGSMDNGYGIGVGWLRHPIIRDKEGRELFVRRMPTFFKHFLVFL
jgi:hypothetical protein